MAISNIVCIFAKIKLKIMNLTLEITKDLVKKLQALYCTGIEVNARRSMSDYPSANPFDLIEKGLAYHVDFLTIYNDTVVANWKKGSGLTVRTGHGFINENFFIFENKL